LENFDVSYKKINAELMDLEERQLVEQDLKLNEDQELAALKNERAMLRIELDEFLAVCSTFQYFIFKYLE
jgi:hypothetical protein